MTTKFITLISVIGLASICLVQGQSPTPGEPPAASPLPDESPAASPSPTKAAPSPAASPSPAEKRKPKTSAASPAPASLAPATRGGPGMVWVSTDSRVYYKQGSRFYGKTKNGKYMSEAERRKEGNRPAAQEY